MLFHEAMQTGWIVWGDDWSTYPWPKRLWLEANWWLWRKWWYAIVDLAGNLYWKWHDWIHRNCK